MIYNDIPLRVIPDICLIENLRNNSLLARSIAYRFPDGLSHPPGPSMLCLRSNCRPGN